MASPGRLKGNKGTIILIVSCAVLLLCVPLAGLFLPLTKLQTAEQARGEVSAHVDDVVATLPAELVTADEQTVNEVPCPADDGIQAVRLDRVIVIDDSFDLGGWPARLRERFRPADGWHVTTHRPDMSGAVVISVRGPELSLVNVRTQNADAGLQLTMTSWSSCTAA